MNERFELVRVERIELSSQPWEGCILTTIRYPHLKYAGATSGIRTPDPRFTKAVL